MLIHRQCCHNKRNIYGWNNFQVLQVKKNKTERNRRNGKIVVHVDWGPNKKQSPTIKEKAPISVQTPWKEISKPCRSAPFTTSGGWFGGFKHHWPWCVVHLVYLARKNEKDSTQLARSHELVRHVREKHENLNYINIERWVHLLHIGHLEEKEVKVSTFDSYQEKTI